MGRHLKRFCRKFALSKSFQLFSRMAAIWGGSMIDFKGSHFEKEIILWGIRWYVAYPISYRQLEEMMNGSIKKWGHLPRNLRFRGRGLANARFQVTEMLTPPLAGLFFLDRLQVINKR